MSHAQQIQMQTVMYRYSKTLDTLSNMLKSMSDASSNIVSNMK